jgi:hypothetical protein
VTPIEDFPRSPGQQVDDRLEALSTLATERGARLLRLREWLGVAQWRLLCIDHPEARNWFDEHGDPR